MTGITRAARVAAWTMALLMPGAPPGLAEEPKGPTAWITPPAARLGERVVYHGRVLFPSGSGPSQVHWVPPEDDERLLWGEPSVRYVQGTAGRAPDVSKKSPAVTPVDSAFVEIPLQVFDVGVVTIPGVRFEVMRGSRAVPHRLPVVELPITPVLSAADSNAALKPLRGPLEAPWWERVPWLLVALGVVLVAAIVWLVRRLLRRKPAPLPAPARIVVTTDPTAEALRELAALRRLGLPQQGMFADHALRLTRIVRRFLERATGLPRPGDTTPELVSRMATSGGSVVGRIEPLMRTWDRVKFARAPSNVAAAEASEQGVETIVRETRGDIVAASQAPDGGLPAARALGAATPSPAGDAEKRP